MRRVIILLCCLMLIIGFYNPKYVKAELSATISVSPASGNYNVGEDFSVELKINGGGQEFTSFGASVTLTNLAIVELTKGSVSQWTTEPNTSSLSFYGAVAGQTSAVTVLTAKLRGSQAGSASINITGGSVKQTDGFTVTEIFSSQSGGSYQINEIPVAVQPSAPAQSVTPQQSDSTVSKPKSPSTGQTNKPVEAPVVAETPTEEAVQAEEVAVTVLPPVPDLPEEKKSFVKRWLKYQEDADLTIELKSNDFKVDTENKSVTNIILTGKAAPNSTVSVYVFSDIASRTVLADPAGSWSAEIDQSLKSGIHEVFALSKTSDDKVVRSDEVFSFKVDADNAKVAEVVRVKSMETFGINFWFWLSLLLLLVLSGLLAVVLIKRHQRTY